LKSKSTEEVSSKRSISLRESSNKKSESVKSSIRTKTSMSSVLPRVKVSKEPPPDGEPRDCQERPIEVSEESDVSVDGIQLELDTVLPELVKTVTITELKSTRKSTELVSVLDMKEERTMPPLPTI